MSHALLEEEFDAFVRSISAELRGYLARRVPVDHVEDVAQECWTSLWTLTRRYAALLGTAAPVRRPLERALVYRIADRRTADHWRNAARHERRWNAAATELTRQHRVRSAAAGRADLPDWAEALPGGARHLVLLVGEGYTVAEIAAGSGITPNAVSSRLARIRRREGPGPA